MSPGLDSPVLLRAACLLAGGAILGLAANAARPAPVALTGFEPQVTCTADAEATEPVGELHAHDASSMCGREGVFFADARSAERFAEGHVAGAIHLPCSASATGADGAIQRLGAARTIVVYGDSTEEARTVAETLRTRVRPGAEGPHGAADPAGRPLQADIRILKGGFAAWETEGHACASGPCRDCAVAGGAEAR